VVGVAGDDDAFAGAHLELAAGVLEGDMTAGDVEQLFVRMLVLRADPALFQLVADEHEVLGVAHDLAAEAGFGGGHSCVLRGGNDDLFGHAAPVWLELNLVVELRDLGRAGALDGERAASLIVLRRKVEEDGCGFGDEIGGWLEGWRGSSRDGFTAGVA